MSAVASIIPNSALNSALAGDKMSGFDELYRKHYRRVYSICLRMTGNMTEAEDLTQEVFIQLARKIASFRGESAFTTWLHRLTVNQVLMHFRKRSVRSELVGTEKDISEILEDCEQLPSYRSNLQHRKIRAKMADEIPMMAENLWLKKAIAQLPNGYRTIFVMHDVEGYSHEEIAKILDRSTGTTKSQLHKARMKLRRLLLQKA